MGAPLDALLEERLDHERHCFGDVEGYLVLVKVAQIYSATSLMLPRTCFSCRVLLVS